MSASSPSRLRSRHTSCITGSTPSCLSAIATASADACACAAVVSVALTASPYSSKGAKRSCTAASPPASIVSSSAVRTSPPAAIRCSSLDMPPGRRLLVAAGEQVAPRRRVPEAVIDRRPQVIELLAPRQLLRALVALQPDAAHLGLHLAAAVGPHASAWSVPQELRAAHRAREAGGVQHALAAHAATEDRPLDRLLGDGERAHHATTAARRR